MGFNVGDRVRYIQDGDKGTVTRLEGAKIWVSWDDANEAEAWVGSHEISKFGSYGSEGTLTNGDTETTQTFAMNVNRITNKIANLLIEKNQSYGDSALNPVRIFSKADRIEQLNVRIDDKISRIQRGGEYAGDDTEIDLIGYLILRIIAKESA